MRFSHLVLLYLFLYSSSLKSQSTDNNWEVWQNSIPASTGVKVGIVDANLIENINPKTVYVNLPEKPTSDLCIEISSKDGRYKAQRLIPKEKLIKGINPIPWPTRYIDKLSGFSSDEITILARLSQSCDDDPEYMVASSWSPNFNSKHLRF